MIETLPVTAIEPPKFLVEWASPWDEFVTSVRPALQRSPDKLAGEARTGLFPYRGILVTWGMEILAVIALAVIPARLAMMQPYTPPPEKKYDVIYFSGDELPRTEDNGGAQSGRSGRSGGREAFHHTQSIKVARGGAVREQVVDAPDLNLPVTKTAVANLLAFKPLPGPPPAEGLKSSSRVAALPEAAAVAPPPQVTRESLRSTSLLAPTTVVQPRPSAPQRELASLQLPGSQVMAVVPPPVSAPERQTSLNPRLTLPAPTVVAPPPTQIVRELSPRGPGYGPGEPQKQVVPPPVQMSGPVTQRASRPGLDGDVNVVAPAPVQMRAGATQRRGLGLEEGDAAVAPPPVQMRAGATSQRQGAGLSGNLTAVAPPPSLTGAGSVGGAGTGARGGGLGGPFDSGDVATPPKAGGTGSGTGVVVSSQPGQQTGLPSSGGQGSLAMSPNGGSDAGVGGSGGGTGIGRGKDQGSGFSGEGPGAGRDGSGRGSDPNARAGISPYPGTGGAGSASGTKPAMPGVSVRGGSNNIVTLPSFGADGDQPATPGRTNTAKDPHNMNITVVASSRSGGAFNFYGYLKGDKVYTIYLDTAAGPAVMQYADASSAARPSSQELSSAEPIRDELPEGIVRSRLVIACILDRSGALKNFRVLEPGNPVSLSKIMAQLPKWKFRPAMRGNEPVEVNAILGFNIDTSDRK